MLILMSDSVICLPWSDYFRSFLVKKKMSTKYPSLHSFTVYIFGNEVQWKCRKFSSYYNHCMFSSKQLLHDITETICVHFPFSMQCNANRCTQGWDLMQLTISTNLPWAFLNEPMQQLLEKKIECVAVKNGS